MQDLPLHPRQDRENREHGLSIQRRRDALIARAEVNPQAFRDALDTLALECVRETLRLTGVDASLRDVHLVAAGEPPPGLAPENARLVEGQIEALRLIEQESRRQKTPSVELLRVVHRTSSPPSDGSFRTGATSAQFGTAQPAPPALIGERVANLLDWLSAESGRGMFPPERAALALARLLEIAPFERGNFRTAHLLLSFFSLAEGYPPLFVRLQEAEELRQEIERAMAFDTPPLVDRLTRALAQGVAFCEESLPPER